MSKVTIDKAAFSGLNGKVVVITGGTTGIGAATVELLHDTGAKIIMGDIVTPPTLPTSSDIHFVKTDVSSYSQLHTLFQTAYKLYNRLDVAISNAGIVENIDLFSKTTTDDEIAQEPSTSVIDVNLKGTIYFSRLAVFYMRKSQRENPPSSSSSSAPASITGGSLVLIASLAAFRGFPGTNMYSASKHGMLGLMRASRHILWFPKQTEAPGVRINVVSPDMTDTLLVSPATSIYLNNNLSVNTPKHVAEAILYLSTSKVNGQNLCVSGGETFEIEQSLAAAEPQWLGEDVSKRIIAGEMALGNVTLYWG